MWVNGGTLYNITNTISRKATAPSASVKGPNVSYVRYSGSESGTFQQENGNGDWAEYKSGTSAVHARFKEQHRDEWSVYLKKSDGASVQLDLWRKKVKVNGSDLFDIVDSKTGTFALATAVPVKGPNVSYVRYSGSEGGSFQQENGNGDWAEYKSGTSAVHARFKEQNRDEWSVYLKKTDGASVQLDLWRKKVKVNGSDLYNIVDSKAGTIARTTAAPENHYTAPRTPATNSPQRLPAYTPPPQAPRQAPPSPPQKPTMGNHSSGKSRFK